MLRKMNAQPEEHLRISGLSCNVVVVLICRLQDFGVFGLYGCPPVPQLQRVSPHFGQAGQKHLQLASHPTLPSSIVRHMTT